MGGLHIINGTMQSTTNRCTDAALTCATFGSRKPHLQLWVLAGPAHTHALYMKHQCRVQGKQARKRTSFCMHRYIASLTAEEACILQSSLHEDGPACTLHQRTLGQA